MRNALVKYLMHIHGIIDNYYDYCNINRYMHRAFKTLAKKIMCNPQSVCLEDFSELTTLTPEERCHLCIIVMEVKKRVELIYVTRTLSELIAM